MARQVLLVSAFLLFLNVSLVLCRDDYYQHFSNQFSHYHRKSTPEDNVSSTEASVPPSEEPSEVSGLPHETALKSTGESGGKQHGYEYDYDLRVTNDAMIAAYNSMVIVTVVSVLVSVAFLIIGLSVIFCCGKNIGRTVRPGYVFSRPAVGVQPQQPAYADSPQLTHNPQGVEYQKLPPPYNEPPAQQLYSPVQQQMPLQ